MSEMSNEKSIRLIKYYEDFVLEKGCFGCGRDPSNIFFVKDNYCGRTVCECGSWFARDQNDLPAIMRIRLDLLIFHNGVISYTVLWKRYNLYEIDLDDLPRFKSMDEVTEFENVIKNKAELLNILE